MSEASNDDRARWQRIRTDQAVDAFRVLETKRLQLERAEFALQQMLNGTIDRDRYFQETEKIREQTEERRAHYAERGLLPKDAVR